MIFLFFLLTLALYDDLALKKCKDDNWSIHGLWPEYNDSSWPQFCNKSRYNELTAKSIHSILPQMEKYWYSCSDLQIYDLNAGNNWDFWQHEWEKHGSCQNRTVFHYFNDTLTSFVSSTNIIHKCCFNQTEICLIHLNSINLEWLGYC